MLAFNPEAPFVGTSQSVLLIQGGVNLAFECLRPTPMILMAQLRPEREKDLVQPEILTFLPNIPRSSYIDGFGNKCLRFKAPIGFLSIWSRFLLADSGAPEQLPYDAYQHDVAELPENVLPFLLGSRYCDTQLLMQQAWYLFGHYQEGWPRAEAILDFVHRHIRFDYQSARNDRTASHAFIERRGVCRDFAHLATAFFRCMNIPARYCTGYLGDIGVPRDPAPMDFSAWCEVYMGGQWWTLDARHHQPRIGRLLVARGRDAADVAITTSFGQALLTEFTVITEEDVAAL